jgi:CBS domain containing-hemolysin-like protein
MAAVIDEWGAFEGIATVEDVVEALVGDLRDEFDVDEREPSIRRRGDDGYDIDGGVSLLKVNDVIEGDFTSEEVETIGGLVLERLNRAPERGDRVEVAGYVAEVTSVEGTRISTVRVREGETDDPLKD